MSVSKEPISSSAPPSQSQPQNFQLFKIVKLIGLKRQPEKFENKLGVRFPGRKLSGNLKVPQKIKENVTIKLVAVGGYKGHSFVAMACSNDFLILRYVGESGVPMVRQLPWFKITGNFIVSMDFSPTADWLLCSSPDGVLFLVPVQNLMGIKTNSSGDGAANADNLSTSNDKDDLAKKLPVSLMDYINPSQNNNVGNFRTTLNLNNITTFPLPSKLKGLNVTQVMWWKSWDQNDYGSYCIYTARRYLCY
jgi:WD40 repeat protein